MRFKSFVTSGVAVLLCGLLSMVIVTNSKQASAEQEAPPQHPPSLQLYLRINEAKKIAGQQIKDLDPKSLWQGSIAPYYSSRRSGLATGTVISFTVAGTHRTEKLGEMVEKVIVVFPDDPKEIVTARRTRIWLREGLLGITR